MSITTTLAKTTPLVGNGSNKSFPYTFLIPDENSIQVILTEVSTGAETVLSSATYTVSGLGDTAGGTVTYPASGSAITSAYKITVLRVVPYTQPTKIRNQRRYDPKVVEDALDRATMQIQQIKEAADRAIKTPVTDEDALDSGEYLTAILAAQSAAETAETNAETAETNAETAQAAAEAARDEAQALVGGAQWANGVVAVNNASSPVTAVDGTLYIVDTSGGNVVINLPALDADSVIGAQKTTGDANTVTINRNGSDTIDGGTSAVVLANGNERRTFSGDFATTNWTTAASGLVSGNYVVDNFTDGVDFTAGSSTTIALSTNPGTENNVTITFDGVTQHHTEYSLSGTTITFSSAIPSGVSEIEAKIGASAQINVPADNSVGLDQLQHGTQGDILYYGASGEPFRLGAGTSGQFLKTNGAGANPAWDDLDQAGRLLDIEYFTSSGTWTKPAGCTAVRVTVVGGGGGGGGADSPGTGGNGGNSSFGAFCSANGGSGGVGGLPDGKYDGGAGGTATGGDINASGSRGSDGMAINSSFSNGGAGGSSMFGGGGGAQWAKTATSSNVGNAASGFGGGGGGGSYFSGSAYGASGGGGGGTSIEYITSGLGSSETVTVGAAGSGGTSGTSSNGGAGTQGLVIVESYA